MRRKRKYSPWKIPFFDLKSSTSGLAVYGYVSDREKHPVAGATVTIKSSTDGQGGGQTESSGFLGLWWTRR